MEKSHVLRKTNSGWKIVINDGLSKTLIKAMPYGNVWMDEPTSFLDSEIAKTSTVVLHSGQSSCYTVQQLVLYIVNNFLYFTLL